MGVPIEIAVVTANDIGQVRTVRQPYGWGVPFCRLCDRSDRTTIRDNRFHKANNA